MSQRKNPKKKNDKLKSFLKGQAIIFLIYTVIFSAFSAASVATDTGKENMIYVSLIFLAISAFASGFITGIKERRNGLISGVLSALPITLLLIALSFVFNGFHADFTLLVSVAVSLLLSALGGIVSVNIRLK